MGYQYRGNGQTPAEENYRLYEARVRAAATKGLTHLPPSNIPPALVAQCGTPQGYLAHRRKGEEACEWCKMANRLRVRFSRGAKLDPKMYHYGEHCGSLTGYRLHIEKGETACVPCADVHSLYKRTWNVKRRVRQYFAEYYMKRYLKDEQYFDMLVDSLVQARPGRRLKGLILAEIARLQGVESTSCLPSEVKS